MRESIPLSTIVVPLVVAVVVGVAPVASQPAWAKSAITPPFEEARVVADGECLANPLRTPFAECEEVADATNEGLLHARAHISSPATQEAGETIASAYARAEFEHSLRQAGKKKGGSLTVVFNLDVWPAPVASASSGNDFADVYLHGFLRAACANPSCFTNFSVPLASSSPCSSCLAPGSNTLSVSVFAPQGVPVGDARVGLYLSASANLGGDRLPKLEQDRATAEAWVNARSIEVQWM